MVRKIEVKLLEEEVSRQATFAKRRNGLIKKAFETCVLCDVDVAFIAFSPTGRLNHFSGNKRIEDVLTRFISLPEHIRHCPIEEPESLLQILSDLKRQTAEATLDNQILDIEQEINEVRRKIEIAEAEIRNYKPDLESVTSVDEAESREQFLCDTLGLLMARKIETELLELEESDSSSPKQSINAPERLELEARYGRSPSTDDDDEVNHPPQNESTIINHPTQDEPASSHLDSLQTQTFIPYKPQAIKYNELLDQGKKLPVTQSLQEVANNGTINTEAMAISNSPYWHPFGTSSSLPTIDTPPLNPPTATVLVEQEEGLSSFELEEANSFPQNQLNSKENLVSSRRPSSTGFSNILEQATELPAEQHGNEVMPLHIDMHLSSDYNLLISNLPPEFRLDSSSRHQMTQTQPTYPLNAPELGPRDGGGPSFNPEQVNNWLPQNQPGMIDQNFSQSEPLIPSRTQQLPFDLNSCHSFEPTHHNFMQSEPLTTSCLPSRPQENRFFELHNHVTAGSSVDRHIHGSNMPSQPHLGMASNQLATPIPPVYCPTRQEIASRNMGYMLQNQQGGGDPNYYRHVMQRRHGMNFQNESEGASISRNKRKLIWLDGIPPMIDHEEVNSYLDQYHNLNAFEPLNPSRTAPPAVYDPVYEGLGLHVDPHLRLFLAKNERGNGGP